MCEWRVSRSLSTRIVSFSRYRFLEVLLEKSSVLESRAHRTVLLASGRRRCGRLGRLADEFDGGVVVLRDLTTGRVGGRGYRYEARFVVDDVIEWWRGKGRGG